MTTLIVTDGPGLTDTDLDNIEAAAKGKSGLMSRRFAHPEDTLKLVAEVRRLREQFRNEDYLMQHLRSLGYEVTDPHEPGSES